MARITKLVNNSKATATTSTTKSTFGTISIVNKYKNPNHVYCGRGSVVGNPFRKGGKDTKDVVCDKYEIWFQENVNSPEIQGFLKPILSDLRRGLNVNLGCFCAPKRCHTETIKRYLESCLAAAPTEEYVQPEHTPEVITSLKDNEVFVFGSNGKGAHGKGAAKAAMKFGAVYGQAEGMQGNTYAVITKKDWRVAKSSSIQEIQEGINTMLHFAASNTDKTFLVTKLGCGLGGYTTKEIASLFQGNIPQNVVLPKDFSNRPKRSLTYTGIGSRATPPEVLALMGKASKRLEELGYTLLSGGAKGADSAFAEPVTNKVVFLPWKGFSGKQGVIGVSGDSLELAAKYHPAWGKLSQGARKLMARNMHQVLGEDLKSPVDFILCWTPDGAENSTSMKTGGTGQAIRLANSRGIPVFNMWHKDALNRLSELIKG